MKPVHSSEQKNSYIKFIFKLNVISLQHYGEHATIPNVSIVIEKHFSNCGNANSSLRTLQKYCKSSKIKIKSDILLSLFMSSRLLMCIYQQKREQCII